MVSPPERNAGKSPRPQTPETKKDRERPNDIVEAILGLAVCIGIVIYVSQPDVKLSGWQNVLAFLGIFAGAAAVVRYLAKRRRKNHP
jgi:uncharacterized membrane protein AbrB (regulator of aidB expression)